MFKNKKELVMALMEGRDIRTEDGAKLIYDESFTNPFRVVHTEGDSSSIEETWSCFDTAKEVVHWYENLNKPVLCRVWDYPNEKHIRLIEHYVNGGYYSQGRMWKHAELLTKKEMLGYLYVEGE